MRLFHSIRMQILFYTSVCVAIVTIAGNLFIYHYLGDIIETKASTINRLNMEFIAAQLKAELDKAWNLVNLCSSHSNVIVGAESNIPAKSTDFRFWLNAQQLMNNSIASSGLGLYINQMMVFRQQDNFMIQASTQIHQGHFVDSVQIQNSRLFRQLAANNFSDLLVFSPTSPVTGRASPCLVSIRPVSRGPLETATAWLYTEFSLNLFTDILSTFDEVGDYFVTTPDGYIADTAGTRFQSFDSEDFVDGSTVTDQNTTWQLSQAPLGFGFPLCSMRDASALDPDQSQILHTLLLALFTSLMAGLGISVILSSMLSKPILRLTSHIKKISENDLSFNPEIEQGQDEITEIGRVVNEMTLSVRHLLDETEHQAEQKRKIEIAMLQSQVNPHFLYNTLDSIHWMAVIQKNTGIQQMTRSLSNLLKNMAKGYDQKVSLGEEIKLLEDYVNIQSIRYMDTFELKNNIPPSLYRFRIIKLTLQPLVENAIFHGIEPTGRFGTISLSAQEQGEDLLIIVEDDGVGMDTATIEKALAGTTKPSPDSMNGIGVGNVSQRLKLVYGAGYGLSIESVPQKYTRMIVHIPKEEVCSNELPCSSG